MIERFERLCHKDEYAIPQQGIDPKSQFYVERRDLLDYIKKSVNQVVILKSLPASGKSTLLNALLMELCREGVNAVMISCHSESDFELKLCDIGMLIADHNSRSLQSAWDVVLLDDCHLTYKYGDIWKRLTKENWVNNLNRSVRFVGTATRGYKDDCTTPAGAGIIGWESYVLGDVTVPGLRATADVAYEFISKVKAVAWPLCPDRLCALILGQCAGHFGAIAISMLQLKQKASNKNESEDDLCRWYLSNTMVDLCNRIWASTNRIVTDSSMVSRVADSLKKNISLPDEVYSELVNCFIIFDNDDHLPRFYMPLARRRMMKALFPCRGIFNPQTDQSSIDDFLVAVLQKMEGNEVRSCLEYGARNNAKETPLQHLFDAALRGVLSAEVEVNSELSVGPNNHHSLDFFVNSGVDWGFELLVNGDDICGHIGRFKDGGAYAGLAKAWRVVDFRAPNSNPRNEYDGYVSVTFDDQYCSAKVSWWKGSGIVERRVSFYGSALQHIEELV